MARAEESSIEKAAFAEVLESPVGDEQKPPVLATDREIPVYRLYKRRYLGVVGLVRTTLKPTMVLWLICLHSVSPQCSCRYDISLVRTHRKRRCVPCILSQSTMLKLFSVATAFNISLTRVNWLSNVTGIVYLPIALGMPPFCAKYGLRRSVCSLPSTTASPCSQQEFSAKSARLVLSSPPGCDMRARSNRYPQTAPTLFSSLLRYDYRIFSVTLDTERHGQMFAGVAQPIFQVLAPIYAELWFDLRGRGTATTILSISNIVGGKLSSRSKTIISTIVGQVPLPRSLAQTLAEFERRS
jgi:hypothetical protein